MRSVIDHDQALNDLADRMLEVAGSPKSPTKHDIDLALKDYDRVAVASTLLALRLILADENLTFKVDSEDRLLRDLMSDPNVRPPIYLHVIEDGDAFKIRIECQEVADRTHVLQLISGFEDKWQSFVEMPLPPVTQHPPLVAILTPTP